MGLVSEYDLLARTGLTARDVMSSAVVSVTEDTGVDEVRHLLVGRRIRRVPVLTGAPPRGHHQPQRPGLADGNRVGVPGVR